MRRHWRPRAAAVDGRLYVVTRRDLDDDDDSFREGQPGDGYWEMGLVVVEMADVRGLG